MSETPDPGEFEGMSAFSVNVYIEYLDASTGESEDILPEGGMVFETDSAAVAEAVAAFLVEVARSLPAVDERQIEEGSFESLLGGA